MSPTVPRPERAVNPTPLNTGGGLRVGVPSIDSGQTLGVAEKAVAEIYQKQLNDANQLATLDAENQLSSFAADLLEDPEKGLFNRRGKEAFGIHKEAQAAWKQKIAEIESNLANDTQRLAFRQRSSALWNNVNVRLLRHTSQEALKYDNEETKAFLVNRDNDISNFYQDAEKVKELIAEKRAAIADYASRNGLSEDSRALMLDRSTSEAHEIVIQRMLDGNQDVAAKKYFSEHKTEIADKDIRRNIEKIIEEGSLRGEAQRKADRIVERASTMTEALAEVRKIKDVDVRDETRRRVRAFYDDVAAGERESLNNLYLDAVNLMEANPGRLPSEVVPEDSWNRFTLEQRRALENRSRTVVNNDKKWLEYLSLSREKLAALNRVEFEAYWSQFDPAHRTRAEAMWKAAQGGDTSKFTTIITPSSMAENKWKSLDLGKISKNEDAFAKFEQEFDDRVAYYEATQLGGKRKASRDELKTILNDLAIEKIMVDIDLPWVPFVGVKTVPISERPAGEDIYGVSYREDGGTSAIEPLKEPVVLTPPVEGAKRAPDGNWYIPDPERPGKWRVL